MHRPAYLRTSTCTWMLSSGLHTSGLQQCTLMHLSGLQWCTWMHSSGLQWCTGLHVRTSTMYLDALVRTVTMHCEAYRIGPVTFFLTVLLVYHSSVTIRDDELPKLSFHYRNYPFLKPKPTTHLEQYTSKE